jgi:hypothetical protein
MHAARVSSSDRRWPVEVVLLAFLDLIVLLLLVLAVGQAR